MTRALVINNQVREFGMSTMGWETPIIKTWAIYGMWEGRGVVFKATQLETAQIAVHFVRLFDISSFAQLLRQIKITLFN